MLPKNELKRVRDAYLEKYYPKKLHPYLSHEGDHQIHYEQTRLDGAFQHEPPHEDQGPADCPRRGFSLIRTTTELFFYLPSSTIIKLLSNIFEISSIIPSPFDGGGYGWGWSFDRLRMVHGELVEPSHLPFIPSHEGMGGKFLTVDCRKC
jgi:hypothetical protein